MTVDFPWEETPRHGRAARVTHAPEKDDSSESSDFDQFASKQSGSEQSERYQTDSGSFISCH